LKTEGLISDFLTQPQTNLSLICRSDENYPSEILIRSNRHIKWQISRL